MADVSGKGVPAALFMMASKIMIANYAKMGKTPSEILTITNDTICSNNQEEMFVTVWLGVFEISTGKLIASNAGHEYPVFMRDGKFEVYKDQHGMVIGYEAGMTYKDYEVTLKPGDKLFLYTDGVPEATDKDEKLFGMERMVSALNTAPEETPEQILQNIREAVDEFVQSEEQFDDLTMLCFEYRSREQS
jgi:sigma-B regulation protein RsbU (phosphoserine phosphatase)